MSWEKIWASQEVATVNHSIDTSVEGNIIDCPKLDSENIIIKYAYT